MQGILQRPTSDAVATKGKGQRFPVRRSGHAPAQWTEAPRIGDRIPVVQPTVCIQHGGIAPVHGLCAGPSEAPVLGLRQCRDGVIVPVQFRTQVLSEPPLVADEDHRVGMSVVDQWRLPYLCHEVDCGGHGRQKEQDTPHALS